MSLIPNNTIGNATNSNSSLSFSAGVLIGTAPTGFDTDYQSEWLEVSGMSNLLVQCQSTDFGLTPDSTVGSAYIIIEVANGVYPSFIINNQLGGFIVDRFLVPLTNDRPDYPSSAITRNYNINSKFVRIFVGFPNINALVGNQYAKLYVNLLASA